MSEEILTYKNHENQIFEKYFFNNYIPSTIGGTPDTAVLQFLLALHSILNTTVAASDILRNWIGDVSWFTVRLADIFQVPRFDDDSDREYYDRLIALIDAKQDEGTVRTAVGTLLLDAVTTLGTDVYFSYLTVQGNWGDDAVPSTYQLFWNNSPNDVWGDANVTLRPVTTVNIQFANSVLDGLQGWFRLDGDTKDSVFNDETIITSGNTISFIPGTPDTITRGVGDWQTYMDSDSVVTVRGTEDNDSRYDVASATALTLTLNSNNALVSEVLVSETLEFRSEQNHHGTNNGVEFDYARWNYGGHFTRSDSDYVDIFHVDLPDLKTDFSWSFWFKFHTLPDAYEVLMNGRDSGGTNRQSLTLLASGKLEMTITNDAASTSFQPSVTVFEPNKWYHIVYTWDFSATSRELFVETVSDTIHVHAGAYTDTFDEYQLGAAIGANTYNGQLEEARIYNKILSPAEIALLYNYKLTYDYWSAEMNFTKLSKIIDLYRPPGTTVELQLLTP